MNNRKRKRAIYAKPVENELEYYIWFDEFMNYHETTFQKWKEYNHKEILKDIFEPTSAHSCYAS